jgi:hypothetical protein
MNKLNEIKSFLRWRVVLVRYLTRIMNKKINIAISDYPNIDADISELQVNGYMQGLELNKIQVNEILDLYNDKIKSVVPKVSGHPFVNLVTDEDITIDNPIVKLTFSKEILDPAIKYFNGEISLDSIQFLYSWPTSGEMRDSQKWHYDYGDSKSYHAIIYLNDVTDITYGPFTFINKFDSKKIKWSPFIRRVEDDQFKKELSNGEILFFYGNAGKSVIVDPACCYHYGSRCKTPRLALFLTFNTSNPFVPPIDLIQRNKLKLIDIGCELRPDLTKPFIAKLLGTAV